MMMTMLYWSHFVRDLFSRESPYLIISSVRFSVIALCLVWVAAPVRSDDRWQSVGGGFSIGSKTDKDATFWGWTLDYSRQLSGQWSFTLGMAFDEETDKTGKEDPKVVQTYSGVFVLNYALSNRWSVGAGFGKGVIDDDNPKGSFDFSALNEDWAIGVVGNCNIWRRGPHNLGISSALEYNLSDSQAQLSLDVGYTFVF